MSSSISALAHSFRQRYSRGSRRSRDQVRTVWLSQGHATYWSLCGKLIAIYAENDLSRELGSAFLLIRRSPKINARLFLPRINSLLSRYGLGNLTLGRKRIIYTGPQVPLGGETFSGKKLFRIKISASEEHKYLSVNDRFNQIAKEHGALKQSSL